MIIAKNMTREEHKLVHDKLTEMKTAGLCEQTYKDGTLVLFWRWTAKGKSLNGAGQDCWEVAARCVLPPNRW